MVKNPPSKAGRVGWTPGHPRSPVVKNPPSKAGRVSWTPGQRNSDSTCHGATKLRHCNWSPRATPKRVLYAAIKTLHAATQPNTETNSTKERNTTRKPPDPEPLVLAPHLHTLPLHHVDWLSRHSWFHLDPPFAHCLARESRVSDGRSWSLTA